MKQNTVVKAAAGGILAGVLALTTIPPVALVQSREPVTITVTDKERVTDSNGSKYLIFTEQGTFEVTDSLVATRWNSSDVYGEIEEGGTYTATRQGWRVPFMSLYPNLLDVEEVTP